MLDRDRTYISKDIIGCTNRLSLFLSAHTQAAAYLIGETAAEKIIAEYN